jgi:hypothetical protein
MELRDLMKKGNELFKENFDAARYGIAIEVDCLLTPSDEELKHLVDIGVRIYQEIEYATPMGIGCAIGSYCESKITDNEDFDVISLDYDTLLNVYFNDDWS